MLDFSIVIPTFNRNHSLERTLAAIAALNYPSDRLEVIVVNDGGPAFPESPGAAYGEQFRLRFLWQPNSGPGAARNRGAAEAEGTYLAFTDDDCAPQPEWLREFERALRNAPGALCGGRAVTPAPGCAATQATQILVNYLYARYNPAETAGAFYPTNNIVVPRQDFLAMGGFDERLRFGEDREFCYRWQVQGKPFASVPQAVVQHFHPLGLASFLRLHFHYGCGTGRFRRVCKEKGMPGPGYNSPLWYFGLLGQGLKREPGGRGLLLSLLIAASQAASLAGVVYASAGRPVRQTGNGGSRVPGE